MDISSLEQGIVAGRPSFGKGKSGKGKTFTDLPPPPKAKPASKATRKGYLSNKSFAHHVQKPTEVDEQQKELNAKVMAYAEEKTGITTAEQRRAYWLSSTMERWYHPVENLTFKTHFLTMTEEEKFAILLRFYFPIPREGETQQIPNISDIDNLKMIDRLLGFNLNFNKVADIHEKSQTFLEQLSTKIDVAIDGHFKNGVFIKLTSSSPKDSKLVTGIALQKLQEGEIGVAKDSSLYHRSRCIRYFDEKIRAQKITSNNGIWATQLLTTSTKVMQDLLEDLLPSCAVEADQKEMIKLALREYDERMSMAREFRIFIFDGKLTGVTQSLHLFPLPEIEERKHEIEQDIRDWFEVAVKPIIDARQVPNHFCIDVLWTPDEKDIKEDFTKIKLIEINPFDGVEWSVFKGSTGLFDLKAQRHYQQPDCFQLLAIDPDRMKSLGLEDMTGMKKGDLKMEATKIDLADPIEHSGVVAYNGIARKYPYNPNPLSPDYDPNVFFRTCTDAMSRDELQRILPEAKFIFDDQ